MRAHVSSQTLPPDSPSDLMSPFDWESYGKMYTAIEALSDEEKGQCTGHPPTACEKDTLIHTNNAGTLLAAGTEGFLEVRKLAVGLGCWRGRIPPA